MVKNKEIKMKIFERNGQNPTRRNHGYVAKDFAPLQPKRASLELVIIQGKA
jgi:hypothetical protein